ncbi:MAG: chemotaxis protein CheA [Gemmatimonadales bacterium]|nr:chemotaxis protein CheA [Gemmatimonadales bacterium]
MDATRYAALFLAEGREQLAECERLLLALEGAGDRAEALAGLFRAMHTLKGMAATLGHGVIAETAHRTEDLLDGLRAGRLAWTPALPELLLRATDALRAGVEAVAEGGEPPLDEALCRALAAVAAAPEPTGTFAVPVLPGAEPVPLHTTFELRAVGARRVEVTVAPEAPLPGARAMLALARLEALGQVLDLAPPAAAFPRDDFGGTFRCRLVSPAGDDEVAEAVRGVGEIARVAVRVAEAEPAAAPERTARVTLRRLDRLMHASGELVVARNRLLAQVAAAPRDPALAAAADRLAALVGAVQDEVLAMRLVPVAEAFAPFPRVVRELGRTLGRPVRLETDDGGIELDRALLDELADPLLHLVRNAVDHGLEAPAERVAAGKPATGTVTLAARRERDTVSLLVRDDGRGIDRDRVRARAVADGLVDAHAPLDDDALLRVLARPGFSTASRVSGVSGRGVGVDVVFTRLRRLGGSVAVASVPGEGTTFTLRVPRTLALVRALLVDVGAERYAVPLAFVEGVARLRDAGARPVLALGALLGTPEAAAPSGAGPAVLLHVGQRRVALAVDRLVGQQEVMLEAFDPPAALPPWFGGVTILAEGAPALVLDAAALAAEVPAWTA